MLKIETDEKKLIKQTFESPFISENFLNFTKQLLKDIDIEPRDITIPKSFSEHIKRFHFVGEYADSEKNKLDVLAVELIGNTKVARARTFQRNLISKYLQENSCDAAFVAFYSEDKPDWRLSFVKLEYEMTDKGVKVRAGTPPKRYSFLVGPTEPSHTAGTQLLPLLKEHDVKLLISQVEDAFSIEKVTKEFFEKYRKLFEGLEKELKSNHTFLAEAKRNNLDPANFAKRLLGQIVFLYFLQKKGWLGVPKNKTWGDGDKKFLKSLFNSCTKKGQNFFNDYLEYLFYDTLNNPRNEQADHNYSTRFNCKIPFLNGGLFEPEYDWQNSFIYLDNQVFENILDVFELYNFTVKEDEPLDKEVAVDPEMLGKVFENLLEENLRKGKGTYYTPREIVHYMCQESLINYLAANSEVQTEDIRTLIHHSDSNGIEDLPNTIKKAAKQLDGLLADIKVVDPACGSGAFCVGMLQEIVKARLLLNHDLDEYQVKKETIQNCIYGVDIDPGAVDIAQLRLWLSLVVDYDLEDIEPLPNLDYKIMQGNSLLEKLLVGDKSLQLFDPEKVGIKPKMKNLFEEDNQSTLFDQDETTKNIFNKYHKWQVKLFNAKTVKRKQEARDKLNQIETELIEATVKSEIERLDSIDKNTGWYTNPGFGLTEKDAKKKAEIYSTQNKIQAVLNEIKTTGNKPYFLWHLYFGDVFLGKGGFDVVIANPPYVFTRKADFSDGFKKYVKHNYFKLLDSIALKNKANQTGKINLFALFLMKGSLIAKNDGLITFIMPNNILRTTVYSLIRKYILDKCNVMQIVDLGSGIFDKVTAATILMFLQNKNEQHNDDHKIKIISKIKDLNNRKYDVHETKQSFFLTNISYAFNLFLNNEFKIIIDKIENNKSKLGDLCVDIIEGIVAHKELISNSEKSGYFPLIEGKCIGRYFVKRENKFIKWDKGRIHRPRPDYLWEADQKIIIQRISGGISPITAALDINNYKTFASVNNLILKEEYVDLYKYILALLNSRLINWFYANNFSNNSELTVNISKTFLEHLPIAIADNKEQQHINEIVDRIIAAKQNDSEIDTTVLEQQIDQMVHKLYNLTPKEIKIIEESIEK